MAGERLFSGERNDPFNEKDDELRPLFPAKLNGPF